MLTKKRKPPIKKKYVDSPETLWTLFCEYKKAVKANPRKKQDFVGGMGKMVWRKLERPLIMEGFEGFCREKGLIADLKDYFANTGGSYAVYASVCNRIKSNIREDQISGGMCGVYSASITQRICGLVEKTQQQMVEQPLFPDEP